MSLSPRLKNVIFEFFPTQIYYIYTYVYIYIYVETTHMVISDMQIDFGRVTREARDKQWSFDYIRETYRSY